MGRHGQHGAGWGLAGLALAVLGCAGSDQAQLPPAVAEAVPQATSSSATALPPHVGEWSKPPAVQASEPAVGVAALSVIKPDWPRAPHGLALPGALAYDGPAAVSPPSAPPTPLPAGAVARIGGPPGVPRAWRLSPQAQIFVGPSEPGGLALFDARSRQRIAEIRIGHDEDSLDGKRMAFSNDAASFALFVRAERPPEVRMFSTANGAQTASHALPEGVRDLFFGPLGRRAVLLFEERAGRPVRAAVLDLSSGALREHTLAVEPVARRVAALSPDGTMLLLSRPADSQDARAEMVELPAGRVLWSAKGRGRELPHFSPDGVWVAVDGDRGTGLLRARTGKLAYRRAERFAAFTPDGRALLEAHGCLTERDYDGRVRVRFESPENDTPRHVVVTANGWVVMSTTLNEEMYWWERATGRPLLLPAARMHGVRLAFSHDGQELLGDDGEYLHRWSAWDGRPIDRRERRDTLIATASGQRLLATRGAAALAEAAAVGVGATELAENRSFQLSHDGSRLLVTTIGGSAEDVVVDLRSGQVRPIQLLRGNVELSPDGEMLLQYGPSLRLVRSATGDLVRDITLGSKVEIAGGVFHPAGQLVAAVDYSGSGVWLVRLDGGAPPRKLTVAREVNTVAFSPDGRQLVIAYVDGSADVRTADGARTVRRLAGHSAPIHGLAFSPDSSRLATASHDGTALIWNLR